MLTNFASVTDLHCMLLKDANPTWFRRETDSARTLIVFSTWSCSGIGWLVQVAGATITALTKELHP